MFLNIDNRILKDLPWVHIVTLHIYCKCKSGLISSCTVSYHNLALEWFVCNAIYAYKKWVFFLHEYIRVVNKYRLYLNTKRHLHLYRSHQFNIPDEIGTCNYEYVIILISFLSKRLSDAIYWYVQLINAKCFNYK